jgi:hypothetical protein
MAGLRWQNKPALDVPGGDREPPFPPMRSQFTVWLLPGVRCATLGADLKTRLGREAI